MADKRYYLAEERALRPMVTVLGVRHQFMKNFTYLVIDPVTHEAVLVDPAWEMNKIDQALVTAQARLAGILLTHAHVDHVHLAAPLALHHRCPVWMSREEIAVSGFAAPNLEAIGQKTWPVGKMLIQPILTPGHTPGCTCYLIGDNLFAGDVLFAEGCGICPDVAAAHAMFISLQSLKMQLNPETRIFPGHSYGRDPGQTMAQLLRDNIYLQFADRESFTAFRLRKGQDRAKLFTFS